MENACPICRMKDYDKKTYTEGSKRYLLKLIAKMQALTRGFLDRNRFYQNIKDIGY